MLKVNKKKKNQEQQMGSLEVRIPSLKRTPLLIRSFSSARSENNKHPFLQRSKSRVTKFLLFEKVDYLQWICTVVIFLCVVVLFQMFLPGSIMENSKGGGGGSASSSLVDVDWMKIMNWTDFGDGIRFEPSKLLLHKFENGEANLSSSSLSHPRVRSGVRKPQLALVFGDQRVDSEQLLMVTIAVALQEIGYAIQVYSLKGGLMHVVWGSIGVPVVILQNISAPETAVDWLNYDGILVNSLEAKDVFSCLVQEPFKSLPVIWTIHERTLPTRLKKYTTSGQTQIINDWRQAFNRANVVVFPNYVLPMMYSDFDAGNYFVIPGSPDQVWEADNFMALNNRDDLRVEMHYGSNDLVIVIVGSEFSYSGLWLEHAFVLKALFPVFSEFLHSNSSELRVRVYIISASSTSNYKVAVEAIAVNLGYPRGSVRHIGIDGDVNKFLSTADLVIYGSFLEEQSFPSILVQAMSFGIPIIAPDLAVIKKYVDNRVNGYLFLRKNIKILTQVLFQAVSEGKLSPMTQNISLCGKVLARNLMVSETIEGYASLLENVLKFPLEVVPPKAVADIPHRLKEEWQWHLFEKVVDSKYSNRTLISFSFLDKIEELWNHTNLERSSAASLVDESFLYTDWEDEKHIEMINARRKREEDELKDRTEQPLVSWEDVYRNAKRADRAKNDLHERDSRELERTGQPLCIYEPYFGEGTWPFLHHDSLYRGIGLSTKGRRQGEDDVDAPSRLPLLSDPYYRNALGEYGAFFAIAYRIDRIHKNAWIGFQSWRGTARKISLSKVAESALLHAIQVRRHGDTLYFWARMDKDFRNPLQQDFWSFCDSINAGNCRHTVSEALRRMYGVKHDWNSLPPMPVDGDTWSVMHSWVMPTKSFLEFVMFSRIFVDALDAHMYDDHHETGHCHLSLSKDRHCYSRVLELLVNVWAYHSARRLVYVNPETGVMQEQHRLKSRRGKMWIKWFSFTTLKSMDEDLAEEMDSDHPKRRWLWPLTGEVFWQGMYERERNLRHHQKEKRKQQSKDKMSRMRRRIRQKAIGKYVKPSLEDVVVLNSTKTAL